MGDVRGSELQTGLSTADGTTEKYYWGKRTRWCRHERTMVTSEPEPGKEEILEATSRALRKHGYRDLTIQDIADEFDKSKSLLYYHYEGKEMLFADLLQYTTHEFLDELQRSGETPKDQLTHLVDQLLPETVGEERRTAQLALLEFRSQVPHVEVYAQQYTEIDRLFKETVREIIEDGVEQGQFRDVDAELEAELFVSLVSGMRTRRLTSGAFSIETARQALTDHLHQRLFKG